MAVRIKEPIKPYTAGVWIEITENKVINVLLRAMNNLIRVNEDNELYVDLQLDAGISPDDDFPVWVTTGEILQEDWRYQSGTILNWKTTSWDYVRLIYANDNKLYYDPWTGIWIEIWTWGGWVQIWVATASALGLIKLGSDTQQTESAVVATAVSGRTYPVQLNADNQAVVNIPRTDTTYTAWTNITIDQNNEISCTIPPALIYRGNVNWIADLPSSGQQVWDTYFVVWEDAMYSWDWTQWNYVGGTGIDISDLFNKRTDDSDDITEGTTNLFVTRQEKNYWNSKQDPMTGWHWIDITNNEITNTLPFEPENAWVLGYVLKKTSTGYRWAEIRWFDPENAGTTGQVLKKTATGYKWEDESWGGWGWGWWGNFNPDHSWTKWQVLTKGTGNHYDWETLELPSWENNVKFWSINSNNPDTAVLQEIAEWVQLDSQNWAIINDTYKHDIFVFHWINTTGTYPIIEFLGVNRNSEKRTRTAWWQSRWDYTVAWQWELDIFTWPSYGVLVWENPNDLTHTNYISAVTQGIYTTPFIPTEQYQPATKEYVDRAASWSITWVITNNVTGTNLTLTQEWAGTQVQYDALVNNNQVLNWVVYNIIPSS